MSSLSLEERLAIAQLAVNSPMSIKAYAIEHGHPPTSVAYWVKLLRERQNPKTELTIDELANARNEINSLRFVRDDLMGKLQDAYTKIKALQNVVILLGHQVGDE